VTTDVIIIGGGLAGSLAAWRLSAARPDLEVRLIERGATLGGNHTWSFHDSDLSSASRAWVAPLVVAHWPAYRVAFPNLTRTINGGYSSISSSRLHDVVAAALGPRVSFNHDVASVTDHSVTDASGVRHDARVVIDARGDLPVTLPLGWQTFLGQEIECTEPHGLDTPMLMDATIPQVDGYRFIYVLPFDARRLLVEDTCYADTPAIDATRSRRAIAEYLERHGWRVAKTLREETGALPLPLGGRGETFWPDAQPRIGLRAGLFHPTTGYSLPDAVATAERLASLDLRDAAATAGALRAFALQRWRDRGFFRLLNRLLFRAARPDERARVLEQFHRRPVDLIERFYGARLTRTDQCRLLAGRPPVSLRRAIATFRESSVL
jgi:lycopene beta-cyclase